MCGRVRLALDYSEIKIRLKFALDAPAPNYEADYNKPPTMPMLVAMRSVDGRRVPQMMKWGLVPQRAKDTKLPYSTFNARSEEFTTKSAFKDAWGVLGRTGGCRAGMTDMDRLSIGAPH